MSRRIKLHTFHFLFRLFAYLADKSGGWRVFVRPKLLLGSLIVGLGLSSSMQIDAQNQPKKRVVVPLNTVNKPIVTCYEVTTAKPIEEDYIYTVIEQMPQFPGGEKELLKFISNNIIYPDKAKNEKIEGRVICRFLVNKDGSVSDIQVIRSLNSLLDAEAVRVLKLLPNFNPGMQDNNPVRVWYTLPVIFKLKNDVPKN